MACREEDVYYNSVHYDLREQDKALRIRRITDLDTGKTRAEFNCKVPKLHQVSVFGTELGMRLETPEILEQILEELTFLSVPCAVRKTRFTYTRGRITAAVDQVEGMGDYLELEIIGQPRSAVQQAISIRFGTYNFKKIFQLLRTSVLRSFCVYFSMQM